MLLQPVGLLTRRFSLCPSSQTSYKRFSDLWTLSTTTVAGPSFWWGGVLWRVIRENNSRPPQCSQSRDFVPGFIPSAVLFGCTLHYNPVGGRCQMKKYNKKETALELSPVSVNHLLMIHYCHGTRTIPVVLLSRESRTVRVLASSVAVAPTPSARLPNGAYSKPLCTSGAAGMRIVWPLSVAIRE